MVNGYQQWIEDEGEQREGGDECDGGRSQDIYK